jgi:hypothetical protein
VSVLLLSNVRQAIELVVPCTCGLETLYIAAILVESGALSLPLRDLFLDLIKPIETHNGDV